VAVAAYNRRSRCRHEFVGVADKFEPRQSPGVGPQDRRGAAPAQRAFTLIELLVVIGIIALLATLMVAGAGMLSMRARALDTHQRMQSVINSLQQLGQAEGNAAYVIQRDGLGDEFHWDTLRTILTSFNLATGMANIPPNIKLRAAGPASIQVTDFRLEIQVLWLWRDSTGDFINNASGQGWNIPPNDFYTDQNTDGYSSPIGESLDTTMEVRLTAPGVPAVYATKWPNMTETYAAGIYTQTSWPAANWEAPGLATIPPRWSSPWGKPIISRKTKMLTTQLAAHSLRDLTPLNTITLLQAAGILPAGVEGIASYHNDRGTSRPWNDRWGNPLIVVNAVFLPPRFDFDVVGGENESMTLGGGRDFLLKKSKEVYLYNRAVYIAVGAIGPVLETPLPSPWTTADDVSTLRALWEQIRTRCVAATWTETSFANPPWSGVKEGKSGTQRCFLTSPVEIK
jgi:prepilin-type N-terminal cleavage/methylation domain-containing protein